MLTWTPSTDDVAVTGYVVYRFDGLYVSTPVATVTRPTATVPAPPASRCTTCGRGTRPATCRRRPTGLGTRRPTHARPRRPAPSPTRPAHSGATASWPTSGSPISTAAAVNGWLLTFEFGGDQIIGNAWGGRPAVRRDRLAHPGLLEPGHPGRRQRDGRHAGPVDGERRATHLRQAQRCPLHAQLTVRFRLGPNRLPGSGLSCRVRTPRLPYRGRLSCLPMAPDRCPTVCPPSRS